MSSAKVNFYWKENGTPRYLMGTLHRNVSRSRMNEQICRFLPNAMLVDRPDTEMVREIRRANEEAIVADGFHDLALMWVYYTKTGVGGVYAAPADSYADINYSVFYDADSGFEICIFDATTRTLGGIFRGSLEEFLSWTKNQN